MNLLDRLLVGIQGYAKMSLEQEIRMGHRAADLLRDEIFSEVIDVLRQRILDEWSASPLRDTEGQKYLRLMLKVLNDFVGYVEGAYQTGKLAQAEIEDRDKKKRKK